MCISGLRVKSLIEAILITCVFAMGSIKVIIPVSKIREWILFEETVMSDKIKILIAAFMFVNFCFLVGLQAETWRVGANQWDDVKTEGEGDFELRVAQLKSKVNRGDVKGARKAIEQLKEDYPQLTGEDFDAYMKAEMLLAKNKVIKAVRAYEKFLKEYPESGLYEAVLEREYEIAVDFLAGRKRPVLKIFKIKGYAEGEKMMQRIVERAGQSPLAARASISIAESYEKRKKYEDAYEQWSDVHSIWTTGRVGRESLLALGRVKYLTFNGPNYDSSCLVSAKSFYEDFQSRYSRDAEELEISEKVEDITEKIAYKHYNIAEYYHRTGSEQAANLYYQMVVDKWSGTRAAKLAQSRLN